MSYSIMGLNNYNSLFTSLPSTYGTNSISNSIFGSSVVSLYSQRLSNIFSSSLSTNFSALKSDAYDLKAASQNLIETNKSGVFNAKKAASDSIKVTASAQNGAKNQTYKISVSQTAQAQTNKSAAVSSDSASSIAEGTHTVKISSGDKSTFVSFNVKEGQTNKEALQSAAEAINQSKSGVTAKVINDETKNTSYLEITSSQTGTKSSFEVSGDTAVELGIDKVSSESKDAVYALDGKEYTSQSNNITVDNGKVNINLNGVTEKEAAVTVSNDTEAASDGIKSFVKKFNEALSESSSSDSELLQKLGKELKSAVTSKRGSLDSIGIEVASDGTLSIDKEKLNKALEDEPDKVKRIMGGFDGVAAKTKSLSDRLMVVSSIDLGKNSSDMLSFQNYLKNANKSLFNRNQTSGMFVDMLL